MGWRDVVVVEEGQLTSGPTFHAAGRVGQPRSPVALTKMMMYSADPYGRLKEEAGRDPGWHPG